MSQSDPVTVIEIDIDYCNRTFGVGACTAALGGVVLRKCYNTWATCKIKSAYDKGVKTLRFVQPRSGLPIGENYIPALKSASGQSGSVNIAGSDDRMSALGKRAVVTATFSDFTTSDYLTDKYWQERISGTAQIDEPGYDPRDRSSFWAKFKARNPNYAGRALRIIQGTLDGGVFTPVTSRSYVMTGIDGPDSSGNVKITAKDILTLADDNKAMAPKASRGFLSADIDAVATSVTLLPAGIGAEYATSGFAVFGSEIVSFTRSGDVFTIVRGQSGTIAAPHKVNDTFQQTYSPRRQRIDAAIYDLLVNYANIDPAFIPYSAWQAECDRWANNLELTADICKPEGVAKLIGEMAILGVSIWWDDVSQEIRLKINRPEDLANVSEISDDANLIAIKQEDRDADRLTRISFWTVQIDPTRGSSKENFLRQRLLIDADAEVEFSYNDTRIKEIYCRWLNHGDDNLVRILSKRLLNRFNKQPVLYEMSLDVKDDLSLTDVIRLSSRVSADDSGKPANTLMQVIQREDQRAGHTVKVVAQKFQFDGRYGLIAENTRGVYSASSAAEKAKGSYFVNESTLLFGDNSGPYQFS